MPIDPGLLARYNEQITMEYTAAYAYLAMSAWFEGEGLPGMGSWMRAQSEEEIDHALRIYHFVVDRNGKVELGSIEAPDVAFSKPVEVFKAALAQEKAVTASINEIYRAAVDLHDFASLPLLDWFVNEQVEEEATVQQIIDDLTRAGDSGHTILMIDRELGQRGTTSG